MSDRTLLMLDTADVRRALPMDEAVQAMKRVFIELSEGRATAPHRAHLHSDAPPGDVLVMPSTVPSSGATGVKVISLYGENPARGLPMLQSLMLLLDSDTGRPAAIMDGTMLTALRTGAVCGAATDLLALPGASVAAVFGAGLQARTQLEALCAVREIREARVYDPDLARAADMADEMAGLLGIAVRPAASGAEAIRGAHVISTATTSTTPVFDDGDVARGAHINAVGSYKPHVREIPGETVARARVVVDYAPAAREEAGDLLIPLGEGLVGDDVFAIELGPLAAGLLAGRTSADQVTFFKSVGVGVQDTAAAAIALRNARAAGLGKPVELWR